MAVIARTKYQLTKFESEKAKAYSLVAMVKTSVGDTAIIENMNSSSVWNSDFMGVSICKVRSSSGSFEFTVEGQTYLFNNSGASASSTSVGYKLTMASIVETVDSSGNAVMSTQHGSTTRGADGSIVNNGVTYEQKTIAIDNLNARDQFAVEALNSIINKMEQDPTTLSDAAISHYCQQAYRYAAYMMTASANARGVYSDNSEQSGDAKQEAIGILTTPTEKLLNNLIVALERTDTKVLENEKETHAELVKIANFGDIKSDTDTTNKMLQGIRDNLTSGLKSIETVMEKMNTTMETIATRLHEIGISVQGYTQNQSSSSKALNISISGIKDIVDDTKNDVASILSDTKTIKGLMTKRNLDIEGDGESDEDKDNG